MFAELEDLRQRTLDNNLVWLQSFGCRVKREGNVVHVYHPELKDYSALLLFGGPEESYKAFREHTEGRTDCPDRQNVYVDKKAASPGLGQLLKLLGYLKTSVSYVTAGEWKRGGAPGEVLIRPATLEQADYWASVYSLGFGHVAEERVLDRGRWRIAFCANTVRHWFLTRRDAVIGVCQTCVAHGVIGVYSFTLLPAERDRRHFREAVNALGDVMAGDGGGVFYFERVKDLRSAPFISRAPKSPSGFKVIRVAEAFRRGI
ncbi:MAG: hypothetical protein JOZ02_13475 [Acidobacteria bacterium]|nr:hypothetical protein [Acidobacteriota bacterium]